MIKKLVFTFLVASGLSTYGQCIKVSDAADQSINGNYSLLEAENFYGYAVYGHSDGKHFLHKDEDNWYINKDKDSPDESPIVFCKDTLKTVPLEGWKTIDGSSPPKFAPKCE